VNLYEWRMRGVISAIHCYFDLFSAARFCYMHIMGLSHTGFR